MGLRSEDWHCPLAREWGRQAVEGSPMEPERRMALEKSATVLDHFGVLRAALDDAEGRARAIHAGSRRAPP